MKICTRFQSKYSPTRSRSNLDRVKPIYGF
jgi:hypothetical protein